MDDLNKPLRFLDKGPNNNPSAHRYDFDQMARNMNVQSEYIFRPKSPTCIQIIKNNFCILLILLIMLTAFYSTKYGGKTVDERENEILRNLNHELMKQNQQIKDSKNTCSQNTTKTFENKPSTQNQKSPTAKKKFKEKFSESILSDYYKDANAALRMGKEASNWSNSQNFDTSINRELDVNEINNSENVLSKTKKIALLAADLNKKLNSQRQLHKNNKAVKDKLAQILKSIALKKDNLLADEKSINEDKTLLDQYKSQRNSTQEEISNLKIKTENLIKKQNIESEKRYNVGLDYERLNKAVEKLRDSLNKSEFKEKELNSQINVTQQQIATMQEAKLHNAELLKKLYAEQQTLMTKSGTTQTDISSKETLIKTQESKVKKIKIMLETIRSFNALLEHLKAEIEEYRNSRKNVSSTEIDKYDEEYNKKLKDIDDVIDRVEKYKLTTFSSLNATQAENKESYDDPQEYLEKELQKLKISMATETENLRILGIKHSQIIERLRKIREEIVRISDNSTLKNSEIKLKQKQETLRIILAQSETIRKNLNVTETELEKQKKSLNEHKDETKKLNESILSLENIIKGKDNDKTKTEKSIYDLIKSRNSVITKYKEKSTELMKEQKQADSRKKELYDLEAKIEDGNEVIARLRSNLNNTLCDSKP